MTYPTDRWLTRGKWQPSVIKSAEPVRYALPGEFSAGGGAQKQDARRLHGADDAVQGTGQPADSFTYDGGTKLAGWIVGAALLVCAVLTGLVLWRCWP